jgi:hypothetical protein
MALKYPSEGAIACKKSTIGPSEGAPGSKMGAINTLGLFKVGM